MNEIEFFFEDLETINFHKNILITKVKYLINSEIKSIGNIAVIFCSDNYLLDINKQYLNHHYYTDIITFDYVEENVISGDLFISVDRIRENAKEYEVEMIKELYRVVFHGVLHLVGYNDKTDEEQRIMTDKENYYLSEVDFKGMKL
ncbi:rRNA maturation RNase YbeY [Prolixibacteraceae bacterium Z1-6]|uniref:Endoribonuclease YbeY n=1 Tax=Draconibacterium aestuarii TaxID=2998507 RepID=A0A9X3F8N8_9BACT|nr:rRNA maturation RNase YbeY [Prolixibacteraceae bacterium Z1-6]